jgi:hypothetical protein
MGWTEGEFLCRGTFSVVCCNVVLQTGTASGTSAGGISLSIGSSVATGDSMTLATGSSSSSAAGDMEFTGGASLSTVAGSGVTAGVDRVVGGE